MLFFFLNSMLYIISIPKNEINGTEYMNHLIGSVSCLAFSIIVMTVAIIHIIVKNNIKMNFVDDFICGCFKCFKNGRLSFNRPNYINLFYCFANSITLKITKRVQELISNYFQLKLTNSFVSYSLDS